MCQLAIAMERSSQVLAAQHPVLGAQGDQLKEGISLSRWERGRDDTDIVLGCDDVCIICRWNNQEKYLK